MTLIAFALNACVVTKLPETEIDRVARAKELPNAPYERVLIVAIASRGTTAREFEEELAIELSNRRTHAFGYRKAAQRADVQEEVVRQVAEENEADAIIFVTAKLVDAQKFVTEEHTDIQAEAMGGRLVDFFRYDYSEYTVPATTGYVLTVAFFTDMFDVESEARIYKVESRTDLGEYTSETIIAESTELAKRLRKDKMVR